MTSSGSGAADGQDGPGVYVYGVVPADVTVTDDARGLGDPPAEVRLVRCGDIAALTSEVAIGQPLGEPADLTTHQQLLDAAATQAPVLPFRFGAVLRDERSVAEELLSPWHDKFAAQLAELEGRRQFVVKGRYDEEAILREVLAENPEAAELREQIAGQPEDATRDARIRLGEILSTAVEAKREADTQLAADTLIPHCVASSVRPPSHELDAVHLAVLVDDEGESDLAGALDELGRDWAGRVELRLLGPMAPYDFVDSSAVED